MSNEDVFYAEVADEVAAGQMDRALWAKAFAQTDGDDNRALAFYIRQRAIALQKQEANRPEKLLPKGLIFQPSSLNYKGKEMRYSQIEGVTFFSVEETVNGLPTQDYHTIRFRSRDDVIRLKRTAYYKIFNGRRKDEFDATYAFAKQHIFPLLLTRLVVPVIEQGQTLSIGGLSTNTTGLSIITQSWFSLNSKKLPWSNYHSVGIQNGAVHIWEKSQTKKKPEHWGKVSLREENAVTIPYIIKIVFKRFSSHLPDRGSTA